MMPTRLCATAATLPLLLALTACDSTDESSSGLSPGQDPAIASSSQLTGPMTERDRREMEEFQEAIRGLRFDHGVVEVTAPLAADAREADRQAAAGDDHIQANRETDAIKAYATAVRHAPDVADLYVRLGYALKTKSELEMAGAAYRTAVALDAELVEPRFELAMTQWSEMHQDEAITTLEGLLAVDPDYGRAHERLAIWNYYAGDYAAAWAHVQQARRVGQPLPPQFLPLLEGKMTDPTAMP